MESPKKLQLPCYMALFIIELSNDLENFGETSLRMDELVAQQEGYLGGQEFETKDEKYITICYWKSIEDIKKWRGNLEHQMAIKYGQEKWFKSYKITISKVEHEYVLESNY